MAARKKKVDWLMIFNLSRSIAKDETLDSRRVRNGPQKRKKNLLSDPPSSKQHTHTHAATTPPPQLLEVGAGPNKIWEGFISVIMHSPPILFLDSGEIEGKEVPALRLIGRLCM